MSSSSPEPPERLLSLFLTRPASPEETAVLRQTSHDELCRALEYWVNQCTLLFGEPVLVQQTHGLADDGVDVLVEFVRSKQKVGFQVKSFGDIAEKGFAKDTIAQIARSRKHSLDQLIVFFAGDVTDLSQREKVRHLVSEISEMDDYAKTIPPERVARMLVAWRNKEHPLAVLDLSKDPSEAILGLAKGLSDELYEASVEVHYEAKQKIDTANFPYRINFKVHIDPKKRPADIINVLKRGHITGQNIRFDETEIDSFEVLKGGVPQPLPGGKPTSLVIKPEKPRISLRIDSTGPNGNVLATADFWFTVKSEGSQIEMSVAEGTGPLIFNIALDPTRQSGKITYILTPGNWSASKVLDAEKFAASLQASKRFRLSVAGTDHMLIEGEVNLPAAPQDPKWLEFLEALAAIEKNTGVEFVVPQQISQKEVYDVIDVASSIRDGKIIADRLSITLVSQPELAKKLLDEAKEKGKITSLDYKQGITANILGKTIDLGQSHVEDLELKFTDGIESIERQLADPETKEIKIRLRTAEESKPVIVLDRFLGKPPSQPK